MKVLVGLMRVGGFEDHFANVREAVVIEVASSKDILSVFRLECERRNWRAPKMYWYLPENGLSEF